MAARSPTKAPWTFTIWQLSDPDNNVRDVVNPVGPGGGENVAPIFLNDVGEPNALRVVDSTGRLVRELHRGSLQAGTHSMSWDDRDDLGREAVNGLYFTVLQTADGLKKAKLMRTREGRAAPKPG